MRVDFGELAIGLQDDENVPQIMVDHTRALPPQQQRPHPVAAKEKTPSLLFSLSACIAMETCLHTSILLVSRRLRDRIDIFSSCPLPWLGVFSEEPVSPDIPPGNYTRAPHRRVDTRT